jgi:uncharacterized protein YkwD
LSAGSRLERVQFLLAGLVLACGSPAAAQARSPQPGRAQDLAEALSAIRSRGCAGRPGTNARLRWVAPLGEVARHIARGVPPSDATQRAGYRANRLFQVTMTGQRSVASAAQTMARNYCAALTDPKLTDGGFHRQGTSYWIVLAAPFEPPALSPDAAAAVAARVLALTNEMRSRPRACGGRSFGPANPLRRNPLLDRAAAVHAQDMAQRGALEHEGRDGSSPADRVTRAGYRWRSVAENIAAGQTTAEQVVQSWARSPEHCANLMNPGVTEMGIGYAVNLKSEAGIYWAQKLARPR